MLFRSVVAAAQVALHHVLVEPGHRDHGEGSGQKLLEEIPPVVQIVEKENPRIVVPRYAKRVENMRTEELIERISKHEPLLAKAVSHMVAYVQDRYPSTFPSKEQTMAVNEYLHSVHADGDGSIVGS